MKHGYDEHIVGLMNLFPEPAPASTTAPSPLPVLKATTGASKSTLSSQKSSVLPKVEKNGGELIAALSLEQLQEAVIIFFDLETTGLNTKQV